MFIKLLSPLKIMSKQKITARTDNQSFYYESFVGRLLGGKARETLIEKEMKHIKKTDSFLEVGCAQGYYLSKALKKTKKVFGFDVSADFISKAKETRAECFVATAEKIPFKSNSFDFVLCTEVLEHIKNWKKAISEIKRVTKKNGKVIVTIPLEKSYFWSFVSLFYPPIETRGHVNLLKTKELEKEFLPFKIKDKKFIQTMSQSINMHLPQKEKISMYCFFVFEK